MDCTINTELLPPVAFRQKGSTGQKLNDKRPKKFYKISMLDSFTLAFKNTIGFCSYFCSILRSFHRLFESLQGRLQIYLPKKINS